MIAIGRIVILLVVLPLVLVVLVGLAGRAFGHDWYVTPEGAWVKSATLRSNSSRTP